MKNRSSKFKTFVSNAIKFCHSAQGNDSKIEFPISLSSQNSEIAFLSRAVSTNSLIKQIIAEIRSITEKKSEIEQEINRKREKILEDAKKSADIMESYYYNSLSSLNNNLKAAAESIKIEIETGLIIENESQRVFLVENINTENQEVSLIQLKDANGLALLNPKTVTKTINDLENYRAIIKSETTSLMNSLDTSKMTVYYQLIEVENNEKLCCPINILPKGISLQDYEIKFNNNQKEITEILNKADGQIKFSTVIMSEDCGLIQASVVEVYSYEVSKHIFNIIHLHIEDMKEEIPVEAIYILDSQTPQEYED